MEKCFVNLKNVLYHSANANRINVIAHFKKSGLVERSIICHKVCNIAGLVCTALVWRSISNVGKIIHTIRRRTPKMK